MAKYYLDDIPPMYDISEIQPKEEVIRQAKKQANTDAGQIARRVASGASVLVWG